MEINELENVRATIKIERNLLKYDNKEGLHLEKRIAKLTLR
jgi:hypothetical protein